MITVETKVSPNVTRESVSCRVCSSMNFEPWLEGRGFTIVRCIDCGLYYVNPQPSSYELEQIYSTYDSGDQWRQGEEHFNSTVARAITRFKQGGTALDVGSGSGNFLRAMRGAGFSVYGVEPSDTGGKYAREHHDIETYTGAVEQFLSSGTDLRFDVVSLLNVLEHLKDPAGVLKGLHSMLQQSGVLAVVVPDARLHAFIGEIRKRLGASDPYWMKTQWHPLVGFDPPHHLCSFDPRTIGRLVEQCGFRVLQVRNAAVVFNQDRWKNVAKLVVRGFSEVLYRGTLGRVVFGYSTLLIARKE